MRLGINKSVSIEALVKGCLKGDSKSQQTLYDRYSGLMYSICLRYVNDRDQAEDVMIGGFMKIFKNISQYSGSGSFEGWMRRIIVNESLGFIRKNKNMYLEVEVEKADYEPDYSKLGDHLEAEDLMKLINELPTGYRTIFSMYAIEGYSHKEIAEMLEISVNTSKSQLSRARVLLQNKLLATEKVLNTKAISHEQ